MKDRLKDRRWTRGWIGALLVILLVGWMMELHADRDIIGTLEAGFASVIRSTVRDGHWLIPEQNGAPRIVKPPMPFWISAGIVKVIGDQSVSMPSIRAGSSLMAILTALIVLRLGRQLFDPLTGLLCAVIWGTCYLTIYEMRSAQHDAYLTAFVALSMLGIWMLLRKQRFGWLVTASGLILAMQAKGPVCLLLSVVPAIVYILIFERERWRVILGLLACSIASALLLVPWGLYMHRTLNIPVDTYTWEAVGRFRSGSAPSDPSYYYLSIVYYVLPWTAFFIASFGLPFKKIELPHRSGAWFVWTWLVAGLVLMSLPREKSDRYVLPLMAGAALLTGYTLSVYIGCVLPEKSRREVWWIHAAALAVVATGATALCIVKQVLPIAQLAVIGVALIALSVAVLVSVGRKRYGPAAGWSAAFAVALGTAIIHVHATSPLFREPLRQLAPDLHAAVGDAPMYTYGPYKPPLQLLYYAHTRAPTLGHRQTIEQLLPDTPLHGKGKLEDRALAVCLKQDVGKTVFILCDPDDEKHVTGIASSQGFDAQPKMDLTTVEPRTNHPRRGLELLELSPVQPAADE